MTESSQRGISSSQEHTIIPPSTTKTATPANTVLHLAIPEQRSMRWNKSCAGYITPSSLLDGREFMCQEYKKEVSALVFRLLTFSPFIREVLRSPSICPPEKPSLLTLDTRSRMFDHTQDLCQNSANSSMLVNWDMAHGKPLLVRSVMVSMKL